MKNSNWTTPFSSYSFKTKIVVTIFLTIFILGVASLFPVLLRTPAIFLYPTVLFFTWFNGFWSGLISTIMCSMFTLLVVRPHLITNPSSDSQGFIRLIVFTSTSLLFLFLITILQNSLRKANRALESRDVFISLASHELRTPLTALQLQLDMANKKLEKNQPVDLKDLIGISLGQVKRLDRLISSMLDLSLFDAHQFIVIPRPCNLNKILQDVVKSFRNHSGVKQPQLLLTMKQEVVGNWDATRIEQVMLNLVHNAIKYGRDKPVEIELSVNNKTALVQIKDQGYGIDKQDYSRIFERFERSERSSSLPGMGLGLYLSKKIVELHLGELTVESSPGEGSVFSVKLPLS